MKALLFARVLLPVLAVLAAPAAALGQEGVTEETVEETTEEAADFKVGHVSIKSLVNRAPQALEAKRRLSEEFAPRDDDLKQIKSEIETLERRQESAEDELSGRERAALDKQVRSLKRKYRRMEDELKEDLNIRRNEELAGVQRIVLQAILDIAREQQYDLLVQQPLFASRRIDVTTTVLERLEQMYEARDSAGN